MRSISTGLAASSLSAILLWAALMVACQPSSPPPGKPSPDLSKVPTQELLRRLGATTADETSQKQQSGAVKPLTNAERWQRTRECAEQSERLARQNRWMIGLPDPVWLLPEWGDQREVRVITDLSNHYSPQYGQCYVEMHYLVRKQAGRQSSPDDRFVVFDAFEGKQVASCLEFKTLNMVEGHPSSYEECSKFVDDRMNK